MKIAVVGSGISGLSAAYYLSKKHKVDLFEKQNHFGGHSHTIDVKISDKITINLLTKNESVPDFLKSQKNLPIITDSEYQILPELSKKII